MDDDAGHSVPSVSGENGDGEDDDSDNNAEAKHHTGSGEAAHQNVKFFLGHVIFPRFQF
jgi:hypothetical protein